MWKGKIWQDSIKMDITEINFKNGQWTELAEMIKTEYGTRGVELTDSANRLLVKLFN
jgi:hypothetical protein